MRPLRFAPVMLLIVGAFIGAHLALSLAPDPAVHAAVAAPLADGKVSGAIHTTGGWSLGGKTVALMQLRGGTLAEVATTSVDAANRFAFEGIPAGERYVVQLLGIDDGPLGPCSDPDPFAVREGETAPALISCWR